MKYAMLVHMDVLESWFNWGNRTLGNLQGERLYTMKSIYVARLHKSRVEEFENEVRGGLDMHSTKRGEGYERQREGQSMALVFPCFVVFTIGVFAHVRAVAFFKIFVLNVFPHRDAKKRTCAERPRYMCGHRIQ